MADGKSWEECVISGCLPEERQHLVWLLECKIVRSKNSRIIQIRCSGELSPYWCLEDVEDWEREPTEEKERHQTDKQLERKLNFSLWFIFKTRNNSNRQAAQLLIRKNYYFGGNHISLLSFFEWWKFDFCRNHITRKSALSESFNHLICLSLRYNPTKRDIPIPLHSTSLQEPYNHVSAFFIIMIFMIILTVLFKWVIYAINVIIVTIIVIIIAM